MINMIRPFIYDQLIREKVSLPKKELGSQMS